MAFHVARIDHVEVFVRDIAASMDWYRATLGLEEVQRWDPEPVMIGRGGTMLALFRAARGAKRASTGEGPETFRWHRVAWHTDRAGFDEAQKHLTRLGVEFTGPIDHKKTLSIYFQDPDGHPLEITCDA